MAENGDPFMMNGGPHRFHMNTPFRTKLSRYKCNEIHAQGVKQNVWPEILGTLQLVVEILTCVSYGTPGPQYHQCLVTIALRIPLKPENLTIKL
jgi:hypothetical protein